MTNSGILEMWSSIKYSCQGFVLGGCVCTASFWAQNGFEIKLGGDWVSTYFIFRLMLRDL